MMTMSTDRTIGPSSLLAPGAITAVRSRFPILERKIHGHRLVYLDNAATTQKPHAVIESARAVQELMYANVHRGVHTLSQEASLAYEAVRTQVSQFIGANDESEVIFTSGTTASINAVMRGLESSVNEGDVLVVTRMCHHANFVPWQWLASKKKARFEIVELTPDGRLDIDDFESKMRLGPKIVALPWISNTLGTINPIATLSRLAKQAGAIVLVDGAQGVAHAPTSVSLWPDVDFFAFSAHKMYGPTGLGVLWGRRKLLESMDPFHFGGGMISRVEDHQSLWNELPWKFEAGTPPIVEVISFGPAIEMLLKLGLDRISEAEQALSQSMLDFLREIPGLRLLGPSSLKDRAGVFSFSLGDIHPHDLSQFLDHQGIAVRAGHHCNQPLMRKLGLMATTRASLAVYNEWSEVEALANSLVAAKRYFL